MPIGITLKVNLDDIKFCNGCPCMHKPLGEVEEDAAWCNLYDCALNHHFYNRKLDVKFYLRLVKCKQENG